MQPIFAGKCPTPLLGHGHGIWELGTNVMMHSRVYNAWAWDEAQLFKALDLLCSVANMLETLLDISNHSL